MARQCTLGSHEIRHEFLYLPDFSVGLMGRDLLCKLRAQITFDLGGTAALKLSGSQANTLILTVAQEEECSSVPLKGGLIRFLSFPSRFQVYGLKITPQVWLEMCPPVVVELKPGVTPVSQKQYISHKAQSEFKNTLTDS
jgi:hypothetical protein